MPIAALLALCLLAAPQDQEKIQKLIAALSDASKDERSKAVEELAKIGPPAIEALRKAAASSDLELKGLATQAIEKIEWIGLERLKKYAKENLDEGASVEPTKIKGLSRWFPDARFYEVATQPAAGGQQAMMVNMGMQAPKSLFAVRKFEDGFYRLVVKGIYSSAAISSFVTKSKVVLPDDDAALDFAVAYMDLQSAAASQNANWMMNNGGSRLEKTAEGYALQSGMYGGHVLFKTDKAGTLVEVDPKGANFNQWGAWTGAKEANEERLKLETEKLKLEIEVLKRQAGKK